MSKDDKARNLIDGFVSQLIELNNGERLPAEWKSWARDAIDTANKEIPPSKRGPKPDIKKELAIFTEYLRISCDENPCLADDGREIDYPTYEEEKVPHGTQAKLARMFGEKEPQISKFIKKWRNDKNLLLLASTELIKKDLFE